MALFRMQTPDSEVRRHKRAPHGAVLVLLLVLAPSGPLLCQTEGRAALDAFLEWKRTGSSQLQFGDALNKYRQKLRADGVSDEVVERTIRLIVAYDEAELYNRVYAAPPEFNTNPNQLLVDAVRDVPQGKALDVGMGQGRNALYLASRGWDVTGFDVAEGGLISNMGWIIADPRRRLRRSAAIVTAADAAVWVAFLLTAPALSRADLDEILAERARRDSETRIELMTHEPVIVAGRWHATFGADYVADKLLGIFAGPAVEWTSLLVVPARYGPARATRRESCVIAAGGFVLSMAFWTALAPAVSTLIRWAWNRTRGGPAIDRHHAR